MRPFHVERAGPGKRLWCDHCEEYVEAVVEVGQPENASSRTASLCLSCARKAVAALAPLVDLHEERMKLGMEDR